MTNSSTHDSLIDAAVRRWGGWTKFSPPPRQQVTDHEATALAGYVGSTPAHARDFHEAAAVLSGAKGDAVVSPDFFSAHPVGRRLQARLISAGHSVNPVAGGVAVVRGVRPAKDVARKFARALEAAVRFTRLSAKPNQFGQQIQSEMQEIRDRTGGTLRADDYLAMFSHDVLADHLADHGDPRERIVRGRQEGVTDRNTFSGNIQRHRFSDGTSLQVMRGITTPNFYVEWGGECATEDRDKIIPWYGTEMTPDELSRWLAEFHEDDCPNLSGIGVYPHEEKSQKFARAIEAVKFGRKPEGVGHAALDQWLGKKQQRPIGTNKVVHRGDNGDIHVRLHGTNVVTAHPDGSFTLRHGGWHTPTTKNTIGDFSGYHPNIRGGVLHLDGKPLVDGVRVNVHQPTVRTHADFHDAIKANPNETTGGLVFADWLQEQGKDAHAEVVRRNAEDWGDPGYVASDIFPLPDHAESGSTAAEAFPSLEGSNVRGYRVGLTQRTNGNSRDSVVWSTGVLPRFEAGRLLNRLRSEGAVFHGGHTHDLSTHAEKFGDEEPDRFARVVVGGGTPGRHLSGEEMFTHAYTTEDGRRLGVVRAVPRNDGKTLHIDWIGPEDVAPGEVANTIGHEGSRGVLHQLVAQYPKAEFVTGLRYGGAKKGTRAVMAIPGRGPAKQQEKAEKYARRPRLSPAQLVDAGIERWRDFVPTGAAPSPGRQVSDPEWERWLSHLDEHAPGFEGGHGEEFHDLSAVLAGTKPAAFVDEHFLNEHPVGQEIAGRLKAGGHSRIKVTTAHPVFPDNAVVGRKGNVAAFAEAVGAGGLQNHTLIGRALGYPAEALLPPEKPKQRPTVEKFSRAPDPFHLVVNQEINKVADRLHQKHGVADVDAFKQRDHYAHILHAMRGDATAAADVATDLLYGKGNGGSLERLHRPGTPLGNLVSTVARFSGIKSRRPREVPFSAIETPDGDPIDPADYRDGGSSPFDPANRSVTEQQRAKYREQAAAKAERTRAAGDDDLAARVLPKIPPGGVPYQTLVKSTGWRGADLERALLAAGAVVVYGGDKGKRGWPVRMVHPPGSSPPESDRVRRWREMVALADTGISPREVGKKLGIHPDNAKRMIATARRRLGELERPIPKQPERFERPRTGDFLAALHRARSPQQQGLIDLADTVSKRVGLTPVSSKAAIHDTPETASANVAHAAEHDDEDRARLAAAWYGLLSQSRSLCLFHVGDGPDALHRFSVKGSGEELRSKLDAHGIKQRTLLPDGDGWRVLIYDRGGKESGRVRSFASEHATGLRTVRGRGELLGDSPDAVADGGTRKAYRDLIDLYEGAHASAAPETQGE